MSQNNRYMAVSVTDTKADTKRPKIGGQSRGTGVQDASVAALERELAIYKRDSGIEMEELRAKVNNMPKGGGGAGEPGKDGVGIESVEQTVTSTESGGENKVEITLTDGQKTEIVIRNGEKGDAGSAENVTPESIGALPVTLPSCPTASVKDVTTTGRYYCWGSSDLPPGVGTYGYLEVFVHPSDVSYRHLRYTPATEEGTWVCSTYDNGASWTDWDRLSTVDTIHQSVSLVGNEDLNTITDEGEYYYGWWQETIQNSPVHSAFHLSVERISAAEVSQTYTAYTGGSNDVWFRQSNNGKTTWSAWKKIATTDQIPATADAVGAVSKSGDTMKGTLSFAPAPNGWASIYKNHNATYDGGTNISDYDKNAKNVTLKLQANANKISFYDTNSVEHDIYHTGNKPTAEDVGAIDAFVGRINGTDIKFDTAFTQGEYQVVSNNETTDTPPYALNGGYAYGKLIVTISDGGSYNGQHNWMWQTYYPTSGGAPYIRTKINDGAFSLWQRIATTDYAVNKAGDKMTGQLTVPLLKVSNFSQPIEIGKYIDMHNPNSPDDDFSVRLIADGDTLKMQRKGVGALDVFYHTNNKPTAEDVGAFGQLGNYSNLISDLNEFKSIGAIYITSAKANQPTNTSPYASVWNIAGIGSTYMIQNFLDVVGMKQYYRGFIDGTWTAWKQIATTDYIDEQILKGEW